MAKNGSKVHNFESIFLILSGGACFRKRRKGLLPIFHAILFAKNEIVHDHWLDKVARDVARKGGWGCIPHRI